MAVLLIGIFVYARALGTEDVMEVARDEHGRHPPGVTRGRAGPDRAPAGGAAGPG